MTITVLSCDKNEDLWEPFHHCMEKYWPLHPEVIYFTETKTNPFYKTISVPHNLAEWTRGVREFLNQINDEIILLMIDDIFIRRRVDTLKITFAEIILHREQNAAMMNFEQSWSDTDLPTEYDGWKRRKHGSPYEVSLMCGLWNRAKLIHVLDRNCDPWTIELSQDPKGYDYYIRSGDPIIDWGYKTFQPCGLVKGKWAEEIVPFFEAEGIKINYSERGFHKIW